MKALLVALCAAVPSTAFAEWKYHAGIQTSFDVLGYRPAKILSDDGAGAFAGGEDTKARGEVRGRFLILGSYLHMDLQVYTVVPERRLVVNLAGLEFSAYVPFHERFRAGFYHHSSHNFSDGSYGWGIDLDALTADALVWRDRFTAGGEPGVVQLRGNFRWFMKGRASPYLLTEQAAVTASDIGTTAWRLAADLELRHRDVRGDCGLAVVSPAFVPSSAQLTAAVTFRTAATFLGDLRDHLFIGPYLMLGGNFQRTETFGGVAFFAGLRLDLIVAESPLQSPAT
jgi:hypothetical protein